MGERSVQDRSTAFTLPCAISSGINTSGCVFTITSSDIAPSSLSGSIELILYLYFFPHSNESIYVNSSCFEIRTLSRYKAYFSTFGIEIHSNVTMRPLPSVFKAPIFILGLRVGY